MKNNKTSDRANATYNVLADRHPLFADEKGVCDWDESLNCAKEDLQKVQKIMELAPCDDDRMEVISNGSIVGEAYIKALRQPDYEIGYDKLYPILAWRDFYKSLKVVIDEYMAAGYVFDTDFLATLNKKAKLANIGG